MKPNCVVIDVIDGLMVLVDCQGVEIVVSADELILINEILEITQKIFFIKETKLCVIRCTSSSSPSDILLFRVSCYLYAGWF